MRTLAGAGDDGDAGDGAMGVAPQLTWKRLVAVRYVRRHVPAMPVHVYWHPSPHGVELLGVPEPGQNGAIVGGPDGGAAPHETPHRLEAASSFNVHVLVPIDPVHMNEHPSPHGVVELGPGESRPGGQNGAMVLAVPVHATLDDPSTATVNVHRDCALRQPSEKQNKKKVFFFSLSLFSRLRHAPRRT